MINENILVVRRRRGEKDPFFIVSKEGYSVETVENGKEATDHQKSRFDIALIDIKLYTWRD